MTEKLKPCPFCGGEAEISVCIPPSHGSQVTFEVWCSNENCVSRKIFLTRSEAIEAWNRRVQHE